MSCSEHADYEERLNDYAGGYLSGPARQEVEEHLLVCAECRDEVRALQALLRDLAALPRSVEAPAEIWPATSDAIRSRMSGRSPASARREAASASRRLMIWMPMAAAAAAVIVAALALYVTFILPAPEIQGPGAVTAEGEAGSADANMAESRSDDGRAEEIALAGEPAFGRTEAEFGQAADDLLAALEARRDELPPRTLAVIEESLNAINKAIAETHEAMESDPDNARLGGLMRAMYRRKMTLLNGASGIPTI